MEFRTVRTSTASGPWWQGGSVIAGPARNENTGPLVKRAGKASSVRQQSLWPRVMVFLNLLFNAALPWAWGTLWGECRSSWAPGVPPYNLVPNLASHCLCSGSQEWRVTAVAGEGAE